MMIRSLAFPGRAIRLIALVNLLSLCVTYAVAQDGSVKEFVSNHHSVLPYNAEACVDCHSSPSVGGSSKVKVVRAGARTDGYYRALTASGVLHSHNEQIATGDSNLLGYRVSLNILGDGLVEALADDTLRSIAEEQVRSTNGVIHGEPAKVSGSGPNTNAIGRFGWKAQHASIQTAVGDAFYSELGVQNPLANPVGLQKLQRADEEDVQSQIDKIVSFLKSTAPISPDLEQQNSQSAHSGYQLFKQIGCDICHVPSLKTAPAGTKVGGGAVTVSGSMGSREIAPFSDFLLHDVGTGDGIIQSVRPQDYTESAANKFRTAPLWGIRFRSWLMHDGKSVTYHQAIMRHAGEAREVVKRYQDLSPVKKEQLRMFLDTL